MTITVRNITLMAILIALHVILSRFFSFHIPFDGVEGIRIGFGTLPLILSGILLGARLGFAAGVIGDLCGFLLVPTGIFFPTFTIASGLHGLLAGMIAGNGGMKEYSRWRTCLAIAVSQILVALILIPGLLWWHFGIPFWVTLPGRVITQAFLIPAYWTLAYAVLNKVKFCYSEQPLG